MNLNFYKRAIFASISFIVGLKTIAQESSCDYFNLPKPNIVPNHFNPTLLDLDGSFKFNVEIKNCNVVYFTTIDSSEDIYYVKKNGQEWSKPKIASFSDPNYNDADPFLTKNGNKMYFISKRPTHQNDKNLDFNIWYADNENGNWMEPKPLDKPINSDEFDEYFFSISDMGNVFFSSNRKGGEGSFDIYTAKILEENKFSEPKNIGKPVNTEKYEFDPYISPDESFIIFSINEKNGSNLYFSKKDEKNHWTEPQSLGDKINITQQDFAPSLSADGKFIFFSNHGKLKWVSSDILNTPNQN